MRPTTLFRRFRQAQFARQAGFTLMELMVGMTIGMIATIVIVQVMTVFEAQKRSTTGSADAQTNGGIALYMIARELQMAGYPMFPGSDTALSCTTTTYGGTGITSNTPVTIDEVPAGANPATDSITIRYGSTTAAGAYTPGVQTPIAAPAGSVAPLGSTLGCQVGDATMINTGTTCAMSTVTAVTGTASVTLGDPTGNVDKANLACLGPWNEVTYSVNGLTSNLERRVRVNGVLGAAVPVVVGIVNIQAQYGVSTTANSNQITSWVDASGGTWAAPSIPTNRNRIKAIRIAVVARNAKIEQSNVTTTAPIMWAGTVTPDTTVWAAPTVLLSTGNPNWQKYRYRVFETIVPLRNVMWSKDTL